MLLHLSPLSCRTDSEGSAVVVKCNSGKTKHPLGILYIDHLLSFRGFGDSFRGSIGNRGCVLNLQSQKPARPIKRLTTSGQVCDCTEYADTFAVSIPQSIFGVPHVSPLFVQAIVGLSSSSSQTLPHVNTILMFTAQTVGFEKDMQWLSSPTRAARRFIRNKPVRT
jgi:hypothetical protein